LDKFFNKVNVPWIHLVWNKNYSSGKLPCLTPILEDPFGGETYLNFLILTKAWQLFCFEMARLVSFGWIFGIDKLFVYIS
jgi:hypothetical protein